MKKRATIRDIASEAGVAVFDSIQIYQQQRICGRGDREKNCGSNQEVGLQAEQACPWVKDQLNKNIVLIVPDIQNPFYSTMGVVSQRLLKEQGYTLSLFNTFGNMKEEMDSVKSAVMMGRMV